MKNKPLKIKPEDRKTIKDLADGGVPRKMIAEMFGVSLSLVGYYANPASRESHLLQQKEKRKTCPQTRMAAKRSKDYLKTPAGRKSIAKSWLRKYLRDKNIVEADVLEVLD